jgi:hypothetical protein
MNATRLAPLLGAPLMSAVLLGAAVAPASGAPATPPATPTPTVASIPAAVQPLVAKIAQQKVNSERYSTTDQTVGTVSVKRGGKSRKLVKHETKVSVGEASLAPLLGKVFVKGSSGALSHIGIGTTSYIYGPYAYEPTHDGKQKRDARPWMLLENVNAGTLFPYHGQGNPSVEVNAGGTGTYAELIDLLATANGAVRIVGPATVDGQQTTELSATVEPLALVAGPSSPGVSDTTQLEVLVTEAGLPLRVVRSEQFGGISVTQTTDVLATEVAVSVKAPPKSKILSRAGLEKLLAPKGSPKGRKK